MLSETGGYTFSSESRVAACKGAARHRHGGVPTSLHRQTLRFEHHMLFMCHKIFFFGFQPIKNVKIILSSSVLQNLVHAGSI